MGILSRVFKVRNISRAASAVLMLCLSITTLEEFIADVCIEEVAHESASVSDQYSDLSSQTAPVTKAQTTGGADSHDDPHPGLHVCHCLHGHIGALSVRSVLAESFVFVANDYEEFASLPASIAFAPPHRPPVVA